MRWRRDAIRKINNIRDIATTFAETFPAFDYGALLDWIMDKYAERAAFEQLVFAPTGTKLHSCAVGIARGLVPGFQVIYPTPRQHVEAHRYNEGVGKTFKLCLRPFLEIANTAGCVFL